jgi:hypothetical protein
VVLSLYAFSKSRAREVTSISRSQGGNDQARQTSTVRILAFDQLKRAANPTISMNGGRPHKTWLPEVTTLTGVTPTRLRWRDQRRPGALTGERETARCCLARTGELRPNAMRGPGASRVRRGSDRVRTGTHPRTPQSDLSWARRSFLWVLSWNRTPNHGRGSSPSRPARFSSWRIARNPR